MALNAEEEKANKTKAAGADVDTETDTETEADPKLVKLVNQAVTGQLKRAMRRHAATLSSLLDEKLAALKPNGTGAAPEAKDRTKDKSSDGAPAANEELEQLRADMAAQAANNKWLNGIPKIADPIEPFSKDGQSAILHTMTEADRHAIRGLTAAINRLAAAMETRNGNSDDV